MACQSTSWKAAPAVLLISAVICFAFSVSSPSSLVKKDQMEVCLLSRGMMLQFLSASLQDGLRLLHRPLPTAPSACLTTRFPNGRTMGLLRSAFEPKNGLGSACSPVAFHLRQGMREPLHLATCLLAQAYGLLLETPQHLWLVGSDDVYQRFTCINHTIHPSSRPPWCSQSSSPLTVG